MLAVVLGLSALGGCGAAVVMAVGRARATAELAAERGRREEAERARVDERATAQGAQSRLAEVLQGQAKLASERAAAEERVAGEQAAHRETRATLAREHAREIEQLEERLTAEIAHAEEVAKERLESIQREKAGIEKRLTEFDTKLRDAFGSLAADALKSNQEQFLALAEQKFAAKSSTVDALVRPIAETLKRTDEKLAVIEAAGAELRTETGRLVRALREPQVRGRYGEMQLRRVAELAGMTRYCDFTEQDQTRDPEGNALQPDMVVRMPSKRTVVVDAKTNIRGYLEAMEAKTPDEAEKCLDRFAKHVADQAAALAKKKYWAQYSGSPGFVVMFIPGDQFIDAALSRQPDILDRAAEQGVILASPSTLIGLLRAVAIGYREQQLAEAAEELRELGKELHERAATAIEHVVKMGQSLRQTVDRYNDFVGSYEKRLEPVLKKFEESGVKSAKELPATPPVEVKVREVMGQLRLLE